ncbi:phosphate acyltransferase [Alphaproteobacteria bacterium]|nr:phosphate acyltransferase [Alphaproteobacteria bacterium]
MDAPASLPSEDGAVTIAVDLMGGDNAPLAIVDGMALAAQEAPDVRFIAYGNAAMVAPLILHNPRLRPVCAVRHSGDKVASDEKPSIALRTGRNSSMWHAIGAVKSGQAAAVVSAGNTGALMAMSKLALRPLPGVHRPAIIAVMPTLVDDKGVVMLDLGAGVEADEGSLVQFAVMGAIYSRALFGAKNPRVGLLNIGEEDIKGRDEIRAAAALLRERDGLDFQFGGFAEGTDIGKGAFDVIVTDGFTGNVALKTVEGTFKLVVGTIKNMAASSIVDKACALLAMPLLRRLVGRVDPRKFNGAMFIGLDGISVKMHGNSDAVAVCHAVLTAASLARAGVTGKIRDNIAASLAAPDPEPPPAG